MTDEERINRAALYYVRKGDIILKGIENDPVIKFRNHLADSSLFKGYLTDLCNQIGNLYGATKSLDQIAGIPNEVISFINKIGNIK